MASTRRIGNENEYDRVNMLLRNKANAMASSNGPATEPTRQALGNVANNNHESKHNAGQKNFKQVLKEVKPKVDTHWKKEPTLKRSGSLQTTNAALVKPNGGGVLGDLTRKQPEVAKVTGTVRTMLIKKTTTITTKTTGGTTSNRFTGEATTDKVISHTSRMLSNVDDIDAMDKNNPQLVSEYVRDIYQYLQRVESKFPVRESYLDNHEEISARMRAVLIEWINEVHFQFHLLPETYFMAIGLIDQYLQATPNIKRKQLQLVGTTALFIAAKYEELYPPVLADFVYMTDNTYSDRQVIEMERVILKQLKFELCRPVIIQFLRRFSKAAHADQSHHVLAKYFIELATVDYAMCHYSPSLTAAAALYLSLILLKTKTSTESVANFLDFWEEKVSPSESSEIKQTIWTPTLTYYSNYTETELRPVVQKLAQMVVAAPKSKTAKSIFTKYSQPKFDKYALIPELSGHLIKQLAK